MFLGFDFNQAQHLILDAQQLTVKMRSDVALNWKPWLNL